MKFKHCKDTSFVLFKARILIVFTVKETICHYHLIQIKIRSPDVDKSKFLKFFFIHLKSFPL